MRKAALIPLNSLALAVAIFLQFLSLFNPWAYVIEGNLKSVFSVYSNLRSPFTVIVIYSMLIDVIYLYLLIRKSYYRKSLYILKTSIILNIIAIVLLFILNISSDMMVLSVGSLYFASSIGLKIFSYEISNLGVIIIEFSSEGSSFVTAT